MADLTDRNGRIAERLRAGVRQVDVAAEFGLTQGAVSKAGARAGVIVSPALRRARIALDLELGFAEVRAVVAERYAVKPGLVAQVERSVRKARRLPRGER